MKSRDYDTRGFRQNKMVGEHPTVLKLISLKFHSLTRLTAFQN